MNPKRGICHIVGASSFHERLQPGPLDYVIAADGGYSHVLSAGVRPNLLMGDFDSLDHIPEGVAIERQPPEKDDTDMMIAIKAGLRFGFRRFVLYGGLGGRLDHTIANAQALCYLAKNNAAGYLVGDGVVLTVIENGAQRFPASCRGYVSVFCMGDQALGVRIRGLKYPLTDARLSCDTPLGVSNEFTGAPGLIGVQNGALLILWYDDAPNQRSWFELRTW